MKKLSILLAATAFLCGGCSDDEAAVHPSGAGEPVVEVRFDMTAVETDTSVEPMARMTAYRNWISSHGRTLILKKAGERWIVERTDTVFLNGKPSRWSTVMKLTGNLPAVTFDMELRPGDYRIVVVLNAESAVVNNELVPGVVVADERDPAQRTPPFISYRIITDHPANRGYRMLNREVFVAVADFTVPKSGDLHDTGMPAVPLRAERRVGKFRMLLKDKPSPQKEYTFDATAHNLKMVFTASDKPFAEGIDAMGEMYYSEEGLTVLPWCMSTMNFHISGNTQYQLSQSNSTVFSPFLFIDPKAGGQSVEISEIVISGASDGFSYRTNQVFTRTISASRITGIVFQTTDVEELDYSPYMVHVEEATDEAGNPENAAEIFDSFFEWNAESDYY